MTLLLTKLRPPPLRPEAVQRPAALDLLSAATPLTLLSAPPGFGKTTLLAAWVAAQAAEHAAPAIAFLALDASDDAPQPFWAAIYAAIAVAAPDAPLPADAPGAAPLLNALALWHRPLVLIIDDAHLLTDADLLRDLTLLIERAPANLRIILAARHAPPLPLARLRAHHAITDIGEAALRFSASEAAAFLRITMRLPLTDAQAAQLAAQTEGWVAGLQLAALTARTGPANQLQLHASNRLLFTYIAEEVLEQQPAPLQQFLLHTAPLDRLCAPLCAAILGVEQARAYALLEQAERADLFLIPLDNAGIWFRYHGLFAEALRARIHATEPASLPTIHRRAAHWYAAQIASDGVAMLQPAIASALAAGDDDLAAQLLAAHGGVLLLDGRRGTLIALAEQIAPASLYASASAVLYAWALALEGKKDAAAEVMHVVGAPAGAAATPPDDGTPAFVRGQILALQGYLAAETDPHHAVLLGQQALALLPDTDHVPQAIVNLTLGMIYRATGDSAAATAALAATVRHSRAAHADTIRQTALLALAQLAREHGDAGAALQHAAALLAETAPAQHWQRCAAHLEAFEASYDTADYAAAAEHLRNAQHEAALLGDTTAQTLLTLKQARLAATTGDRTAAHTLLSAAPTDAAHPPHVAAIFAAERGRTMELLAGGNATPPSSPLIEPLHPREREVLRLLAAGHSNSEIAAILVLALGTVKKHLNNIYGKLGVSSRTQAVARARELGFLDE